MRTGMIIRSLSGFYTVYDGKETIVCKARGKFRKDAFKPVVGDICDFEYDGKSDGYIQNVKKRKNVLVRPPIANIDQAMIVVSCKEPDFSTLLLDRFLALVENENIEPVIVITKTDLLETDSDVYLKIAEYQKAGYQTILTSSKEDYLSADLTKLFKDKITVFTGQSGVGKSSLLNRIFPDLELKTGEISMVLGRGKHTTRHVELFPLFGGWVADTPGFSSLDLVITKEELAVCYRDFKAFAPNCKYRGCLHHHEPYCAVKEAVANNEISKERYDHYISFLEEIQNKKGKY